jgi:hypothetical protein
MRLSAAGHVTARCQLRRDLAIRQTIGVKLFGQRDGIGPCFGICAGCFVCAACQRISCGSRVF